jgi:hypothetical protein
MDAWLDRLRNEITEITANLDDSDWTRAPKGRWNSAQIVEHLGRTYGTTAKMLELKMGVAGKPEIRSAKLSELLLKVLIVDLGVFPTGAKSPEMVTPTGESAGAVALRRALINLERMDDALTASEERWGRHEAIAMHFRLGPLNALQWRRFHYFHGHHHVKQMRKRLGDRAGR